MCHIANRLVDLHSAGYVHRDLKQSNVMWQPQLNRWTLIDFGLVARIGEPAKMGFSLGFAAPEVVIAFRKGESSVIASEAMDAWSLGVLAVELFTNDVGIDLMQGTEQVWLPHRLIVVCAAVSTVAVASRQLCTMQSLGSVY